MIKVTIFKEVDEAQRQYGYNVMPPAGGQIEPSRYSNIGTEEELELDESALYEKKDRCYRLAKQKYDVFPSAYASGFIARCRKGKVSKKKKRNKK